MSSFLTLVGLFVGSLLFAQTPEPAAEQASLIGLVTINGEVAPIGIHVTVKDVSGAECGDFITGEDATFELILPNECGPGAVVGFLLDTGDRSSTQVTISPSTEQSQRVEVEFEELSSAAVQALGVEEADEEPPPVVQLPSTPLAGMDLYVVVGLTVVPALGLLGLMVWFVARRPRKERNGGTSGDVEHSNKHDTERVRPHFRSQIEGMVLVMVVLAVILLGVTDKIGSDGLVSVLAAIVGYTVGRQISNGDEHAGEEPPSG